MKLEWIILDENSEERDCECLCINDTGELLVGYLSKDLSGWYCSGDGCDMDDIQGYIPVKLLSKHFNYQKNG